VEGLGHGSGDQRQMPGRLLAATGTDAEATLRVAAAGIQAIRAEIVTALIATQQALATVALFAMMAEGDGATLHQMQLAPIDERRSAG
jgi:glycine cleavage system pyridoxal-binding protein P